MWTIQSPGLTLLGSYVLLSSFSSSSSSILVQASTYSESITASSLFGSHFGAPSINASYDYVVVGGGTAGLTIATRLAENASNTVAVVEAGSFYEMTNGNLSEVPGYGGYFIGADPAVNNLLVDWGQYTEPNPGLAGRKILYSRGKALGGSSARNYFLFQRSATGAYQKWADEVGDQSYTFSNLKPFFERSVAFQPPNNDIRAANATPSYDPDAFSPEGGPLFATYPNYSASLVSWAKKALQQLGFVDTNAFTDGNLMGYSYALQTLDRETQTRSSSESSFLRQAFIENSNLNVYIQTLAKRILFDEEKRATGVLVNSGGFTYQLNATKEVILSAGAFRSPQLLMVSGIGPKAILDQFDIPMIAELEGVGQNLQDHPLVAVDYQVDLITHQMMSDPTYAAEQLQLYLSNRTGALTSTGGELIAFEKFPASLRATLSNYTRASLASPAAGLPPDWPEIELYFSDAYSGDNRDFAANAPPDAAANYATGFAGLVAPFSRGNVSLASADAADNPRVAANLLGDPRDQDMAVAAFKRAREVFATDALRSVVLGTEVYPGANVTTDAQILAAVMQESTTNYHAAATCKMGVQGDEAAVVDSAARVLGGVSRLRVVDSSAFPFLMPGHPQWTVYMLAEKIADLINNGS